MANIEMTIELLETFRDREMWKEGIMVWDDNRETRIGICNSAIDTIRELQREIEQMKAEKENAIKEIEERKAFNLKCDGQPEWLRKGTDVGLNTALDILKGKDGEQE